MPRKREKRAQGPCGIADALETVGGRWKGDILWWLKDGHKRFNELRRLIPSITPKVLTQELRALVRDGLVEREHHPEIPPRVEYSMTPLGRSAVPLLGSIAEWWMKYGSDVRNAAKRREEKR